MKDKFGIYRPRPARLGWMGVLLVIVGIVLLAACSSSGSDPTASGGSSTSSAYQKALAYSQCIRAHGIPNYPDPNSQGQFIVQNGSSDPASNVSTAVANAALKACKSLAPPSIAQGPSGTKGGGAVTSSQLKFAQCMRSHGEPDFPDPAANGSITLPQGMNPESSQFQNAEKDCQSLMPNNPSGGSAS
jgi:hypothetical protein